MYIVKNAWKNIIRNKGRNILIGIIIVVIASACSVTLAIMKSASDIVKAYQEKNKIEATIGMNRQNLINTFRGEGASQEEMINTFNNIDEISISEIENYGDSKYVTSYYYTYEVSVDAKDITEATDSLVRETTETETTTETRSFGKGDFPGFPGGGEQSQRSTTTKRTEKIFNEKAQNGAFTLIGYDSYENMSKFISGEYTIIDGEVSDDFLSDSVVISEELATLNNLIVGDTITIVNPSDSSKTYEAIITGIYRENTDSASNMSMMFSNSANEIITNINFINKILLEDDSLKYTVSPTYIIKDKESIDKFSAEVSEKGLAEYYTVTSNIDEIEEATKSVQNVKAFAITFLVITLIIGGVVLIVINMINIRERKYEIGVLRTIGMQKSKLSLQFMVELFMVAFVSLMMGAGIGACLSVPVSNNLLSNEIENAANKYDDTLKNFGKMNFGDMPSGGANMPDSKQFRNMDFGVAKVSQVDSIDAVVDFKVLVELLGIGILLTLISSMASMIAIARFSPLTILKERG